MSHTNSTRNLTAVEAAAPPQNLEAERAVLGAVFLSDGNALAILADEAGLRPEDFYRDAHGLIYRGMLELREAGEPVDVLTLVEHLNHARRLEHVGGRGAVDLLAAAVPAVGHVRRYAEIVAENATRRRLIEATDTIRELVHVGTGSTTELVADVARLVQAAATDHAVSDGVYTGVPMNPTATPVEPLPVVPRFPYAHRGSCAIIVGPTGKGRSSLVQAGTYDAARAGLRVLYLGSEVTAAMFHARAALLANRRGDAFTPQLHEELSRARYADLATVMRHAWRQPDQWARQIPAMYEVVVIDPMSAVASALGFDFTKNNEEFAHWYDRVIQPLVSAGVAIVIPENVGHAEEAQRRAKGVSAKQDKPDLMLHSKALSGCLLVTADKVRDERAPFRPGHVWRFHERDRTITCEAVAAGQDAERKFRPTYLMEKLSRWLADNPGAGVRAIRDALPTNKDNADLARDCLIEEGYVDARPEGPQKIGHYHLKPYREAADSTLQASPVATVADRGQTVASHGQDVTVATVAPPVGEATVPATVTSHRGQHHRGQPDPAAVDRAEQLERDHRDLT